MSSEEPKVSSEEPKGAWVDPDDAPELTDEWFDKADFRIGDVLIRSGRSQGAAQRTVTLLLDEAVITAFRAEGPGWKARANEALRKAVGL